MRPLESYHYVWLSVHSHRTAEWLRARLKDGFDIHHIDGDHSNDASTNLVLIDGGDHLMLHNGSTRLWRVKGVKKPMICDAEVGEASYTYRRVGHCWACVAILLNRPQSYCLRHTKLWLRDTLGEWPIAGCYPGPCRGGQHDELRTKAIDARGSLPIGMARLVVPERSAYGVR